MKKTIASCSSLIILSCLQATLTGGPQMMVPMPESFFDGFSVGVYGSFHHTSFDSEATATLTPGLSADLIDPLLSSNESGTIFFSQPGNSVSTTNAGGTSLDAYGGAQIDYGHVFHNRWYLGGSVFGELGKAEDSTSNPINLSAQTEAGFSDLQQIDQLDFNSKTVANGGISTNMQVENGIGGAIKLGMLLSERILAYGKIGAERSRLEVTTTSTLQATTNGQITGGFGAVEAVSHLGNTFSFDPADLSPTASAEEWKTGLVLGAGAEYRMTSSLSMFGEYTYTNYGNVDASSDIESENQTKTFPLSGLNELVVNNKTSAQISNTEASAKVSAVTLGLKYKLPFWT